MKKLKPDYKRERLLHARDLLRKTQAELAAELKCSKSLITKLESGAREITPEFAANFVDRYKQFNFEWLLGGNGVEKFNEKIVKSVDAICNIEIRLIDEPFTDENKREHQYSERFIIDGSLMEALRMKSHWMNQLKLDNTKQDDILTLEKLLDTIRCTYYCEALVNKEMGINNDIIFEIYRDGEFRMYSQYFDNNVEVKRRELLEKSNKLIAEADENHEKLNSYTAEPIDDLVAQMMEWISRRN